MLPMKMIMGCTHVRVEPFVGIKYGLKQPWGLSVMIVGESHYSGNGEPLSSDFTQARIREAVDGVNYPFFTKAVGVFQGCWPDQDTRRLFWSNTAFYNYIQETVGPAARTRPTQRMWEAAKVAFKEVLIEHQPDFVLVLGKDVWLQLPAPLRAGPRVTTPDGRSRESRLYANDAGYAFVFGINHPSSRGWTYSEWTPWVAAALEQAKAFQRQPTF